MAKRKPKRGGRRPGAGRPVSTGSDATKPVRFRVSADERRRGEELASQRGQSIDALAQAAFRREISGQDSG